MISQIISIIILLWVGEDDILCVWALGLNDSIYAERGMTFVILKRQLLNATSFFTVYLSEVRVNMWGSVTRL